MIANGLAVSECNFKGFMENINLQNMEEFNYPIKEKKPYTCPVCGGNGIVPNGFYLSTSGHVLTSSATPEQCKSCSGTGVLWG